MRAEARAVCFRLLAVGDVDGGHQHRRGRRTAGKLQAAAQAEQRAAIAGCRGDVKVHGHGVSAGHRIGQRRPGVGLRLGRNQGKPDGAHEVLPAAAEEFRRGAVHVHELPVAIDDERNLALVKQLPVALRAALEVLLGSPVCGDVTQHGDGTVRLTVLDDRTRGYRQPLRRPVKFRLRADQLVPHRFATQRTRERRKGSACNGGRRINAGLRVGPSQHGASGGIGVREATGGIAHDDAV